MEQQRAMLEADTSSSSNSYSDLDSTDSDSDSDVSDFLMTILLRLLTVNDIQPRVRIDHSHLPQEQKEGEERNVEVST